jgi:hypothetical protein
VEKEFLIIEIRNKMENLNIHRRDFIKYGLAGACAYLLGGCGSSTDETGVGNVYELKSSPDRKIVFGRKSIAIIVDTSGSMRDKIDGERKIDSAKKCLTDILGKYQEHDNIQHDIEAGLFYFKGSGTIVNPVPISNFDYDALKSEIGNMKAKTNTPLGIALAYAERQLNISGTGKKSIIMLTDGESNSGRNPDEVYKAILDANKISSDATSLYLIAFNTSKKPFKKLEELGAKVSEAANESELMDILWQDSKLILEMPDETPLEKALEKK